MSGEKAVHIPLIHKAKRAASIPAIHQPKKPKLPILKVPLPIITIDYDAMGEKLSGTIEGHKFEEIVYSGGSRGHKAVKPALAKLYKHEQASSFTSRMWSTGEKKDAKDNYIERGGTIPPGHYKCKYIKDHKTFHECIELVQEKDAIVLNSPFMNFSVAHGRSGFYIHGAGPKGSDGCLVFHVESKRKELNKAIKSYKGDVMLYVSSFILPAELRVMPKGQMA